MRRGQLNRSEIAKECCFALSSFRSNAGLKRALEETEEKLERSGVFAKSRVAPAPLHPAQTAMQSRLLISGL